MLAVRRYTSFQKGCISRHSHQMWSYDLNAMLHLQQSDDTLEWNLCSLSGLLYHLEYILNLFSCAETFVDSLWMWV